MARSGGERRVVITGMGVICPLGNSLEALWGQVASGASGVRPLQMFDASSFPMSFGAEARQFATDDIAAFGPLEKKLKRTIRKGLKTICREAQMGIAAAQLAMQQAGMEPGGFDPERTGAVFGSDYMVTLPDDFIDSCRKCIGADGRFDFGRWATDGLPSMNPLWLLKYLPNMPAAHLSMYNDLRGPNNSITEREASANLAVGEAARIVARGDADRMIAGSTGTWLHPYKTIQAALQFDLARNGVDPARASRPFDRNRSGMVLGEGAGAIVLEERSQAEERGATIYAEIAGTGSSQVTDRDFKPRCDEALLNAMRRALDDAGLAPEHVGHVHAHGLSTGPMDVAEARAIRTALGSAAQRVPVTAAKSYFGNLGAGSGLVELILSVLAMQRGELFPILNYEQPDADCPIAAVREPGTPPGDAFLNLNVSLQGQASCLAVRRA